MKILAIRSDTAEAELYLMDDAKILAEKKWPAGRLLARDLLGEIEALVTAQLSDVHQLEAIAVFKGPGSFTGLRIAAAVANAWAWAEQLPIVSATGDDWLTVSASRLLNGENERIALPNYSHEPNTPPPKK